MILQTENVSAQGYSTVQSQLLSSPKEKKFEVLVICDTEEQKSGKHTNLPIENDLQVVFMKEFTCFSLKMNDFSYC